MDALVCRNLTRTEAGQNPVTSRSRSRAIGRGMRRETARSVITLGEVAGRADMIEIRCGRCDRRWRLRLLREHGPGASMVEVMCAQLGDCPHKDRALLQNGCGPLLPGPGATVPPTGGGLILKGSRPGIRSARRAPWRAVRPLCRSVERRNALLEQPDTDVMRRRLRTLSARLQLKVGLRGVDRVCDLRGGIGIGIVEIVHARATHDIAIRVGSA